LNPESLRFVRTLESLPSRQQAMIRRVLIRMLNPPAARSDKEFSAACAEMAAKCQAAEGSLEEIEASVQAFFDWCNGKGQGPLSQPPRPRTLRGSRLECLYTPESWETT